MRASRSRSSAGPRCSSWWTTADARSPGDGEVLIQRLARGHQLRRHPQRENSYLAKYELPLVPGGEVAGVRDGRPGERVVALIGTGRLRRVRRGSARRPRSRSRTALDDGRRSRSDPGSHRLAPLPHRARSPAEGECVVVHAAAGGVGSLAVQLGKPMGAGRVIATASSEEKRALALELGADAAVDPAPGGPERSADRGERRQARWTSCSRWPAARSSTSASRRSRRSAGSSPTGSRAASRTRCAPAA